MPNDSFWEGLTDKEKAKVLQWLLQSPTADVVEVKHGHWKEVYKNKVSTVYECSNCSHISLGTSEYCICGAKMDGGKADNE